MKNSAVECASSAARHKKAPTVHSGARGNLFLGASDNDKYEKALLYSAAAPHRHQKEAQEEESLLLAGCLEAEEGEIE